MPRSQGSTRGLGSVDTSSHVSEETNMLPSWAQTSPQNYGVRVMSLKSPVLPVWYSAMGVPGTSPGGGCTTAHIILWLETVPAMFRQLDSNSNSVWNLASAPPRLRGGIWGPGSAQSGWPCQPQLSLSSMRSWQWLLLLSLSLWLSPCYLKTSSF